MRLTTPAWVVGLVISTSFCSFWGAIFAIRGLMLGAGPSGLSASDPRFAAALVALGVAGAALLATVGSGIFRVRARLLPSPIATQLTLGGMMTLVMIGSAVNPDHVTAIRVAYAAIPALTALTTYVVLAALSLAIFELHLRANGGEAVIGLSAVGALVALVGTAAALLPALTAPDVMNTIAWGGDVLLAVCVAQMAIVAGVWRGLIRARRSAFPGSPTDP